VGYISDRLTAAGQPHPLKSALLFIGIVACVWSSVHYLLAARSLREDLARAPE